MKGLCLSFLCLPALLPLAALAKSPSAPTYPDASRKSFTDTESLTAADWVGPDGVVYPRWDKAGVEGGIPSADWPVLGMVQWFPGNRDITDELQAEVDKVGREVLEKGLPGGVVLLPAGTFSLSRPITVVYDGVVIRGMGKGEAGPGTSITRLMFAWDRPAGGKLWVVVQRFDGKLTKDSVLMVLGDARYNWNNEDDPVQPNRTIQEYGLRALDEAGKVIQEHTQARDGVTQQAYFRQWDAGRFTQVLENNQKARFQPWIRYDDDSIVEGDIFEVGDIEWERPPVPGLERNARRIGGHADLRGVFTFIGDQWTERGNKQFLAQPARRGDTVLMFENDLSLPENVGYQPGDIMSVRAEISEHLKKLTGGGHPRTQKVTVVKVEGNRVEIDTPLRISFPVREGDEDKVSFVLPSFPINRVGLEDFVLQFPNRMDWFSAFSTMEARNFWMRDIRVIDVGQYGGFMSSVKNGEIRDCEFIGAHWPLSGGTAYVGFAGCHDSLIENVTGVQQRHAPDFHGGAGNVVRNSNFSGSDLQWHNGYGYEHLVENVAVGDNTFGGSYGRALHTPDTGGQMHSPPGARNVIWNSDIFGPSGGMHLGGYQQGWIFAYNRIHVERGSAFSFRDRQTDHLIIGNTIIIEDLFSPVIRQGGQGRGANTPDKERETAALADLNSGIEVIGNTIHGSNNIINASWQEPDGSSTGLARSFGNRILPPDHAAPRPELPVASLYEAQRANPEGMAPQGNPLYHPDPKFSGTPDKQRLMGETVALINFCRERDVNETPEGWQSEIGKEFGEREGNLSFGWDAPAKQGRSNRAGLDPGTVLYDTHNLFGENPGSEWSIKLPAGRYEVEVGLGDSRYPNWGSHNSFREGTTYYAIHDIILNGELVKDRDGNMDNYDVHHAVVEVSEETGNRLTIQPGPRAGVLKIQFVRLHKAMD